MKQRSACHYFGRAGSVSAGVLLGAVHWLVLLFTVTEVAGSPACKNVCYSPLAGAMKAKYKFVERFGVVVVVF